MLVSNLRKSLPHFSLAMGFLCLSGSFWINLQIANRYLAADGKMKASFEIIETTYNYKYYLILLGLLAIYGGVKNGLKNERRRLSIISILLGLTGIASIVLRSWTFLV